MIAGIFSAFCTTEMEVTARMAGIVERSSRDSFELVTSKSWGGEDCVGASMGEVAWFS